MRVSFLGLGAIGRPMAGHLARQHSLTVWNRTAPTAEAFAREHRCRAAATPAEAVRGAEVVLTCLPTSREVEEILLGPDGAAGSLARGVLVLDCTSGDSESAQRIAAKLGERGIAFADCPVSGGTNGAQAGTLTVMVGADPATFERALPILSAFGKRIEHLGPVGAGSAMKAINNALLALNILAFGEGFSALVKAGVPARKALEVLNASSGRSFVTEGLVPDRVMTGAWPNTFRLALLDKDVGIAVQFVDSQRVEAPLLHLASERLHQARQALGEGADYLEAIRLAEERAGVTIRN